MEGKDRGDVEWRASWGWNAVSGQGECLCWDFFGGSTVWTGKVDNGIGSVLLGVNQIWEG